ncbi:fungal-specific transcription factor domain-containing protein [Aspergillus unguis]
MERATSSNRAPKPARGGALSRRPNESNGRAQRKQQSTADQPQHSQCPISEKSGQPSRKSLRMSKDANYSRRQRNMKNLMMVDRLEANIGRMEARLQELGFDLNQEEISQNPRQPLARENTSSPHSPCASEPEEIMESEQYPGNNFVGSDPPHCATFEHISRAHNMPSPDEARESRRLGEFDGLLLPRCILDTPTPGGISALSQEGMKWMSQKSGVTPQIFPVNDEAPSPDDDFPRKVYCPLPAKEDALSLLYEYLQNFNSFCPLFEQTKLVSLFDRENWDSVPLSPAHWACINVVLALGIAFRVKDGSVAHSEHQRSWLFIKNAFGTFHDLCLGQPDIWSIQALLGMAVFFLGTMSAEPCCFLTTAAIRLSHQIGLADPDRRVGFPSEDIDNRRNIYWISYCLDREISLRFGKPPAQSADDLDMAYPAGSARADGQSMSSMYQCGYFDAFRAHCELATIKGQLYKDLYSAAAKNKPLPEIMASVGTLDERLQHWREGLPREYQPESQGFRLSSSSISVTLLYLHCSYFNCIIAMHQLIAGQGILTAQDLLNRHEKSELPAPPPCDQKTFASESLCASAARASIKLMKYMPEGHISLVGILLHYPIVALATLSSTIVRNPFQASRLTDMKLMDQVDAFLSSLVVSIPNQKVNQLRIHCANYRAAATSAIRKTMQYCGK